MIDWNRLTPAHKAKYELISIGQSDREDNIESLKMLKDLRRSLIRDGKLNDFEPQSIPEIDEMITRVLGRLA